MDQVLKSERRSRILWANSAVRIAGGFNNADRKHRPFVLSSRLDRRNDDHKNKRFVDKRDRRNESEFAYGLCVGDNVGGAFFVGFFFFYFYFVGGSNYFFLFGGFFFGVYE